LSISPPAPLSARRVGLSTAPSITPAAFQAVRAVAAVSLGWIGFSLVGLAPSLAGLDRVTAPVARAIGALRAPGGVVVGVGLMAIAAASLVAPATALSVSCLH
jgi:hypothetical protein